MSFRNGTPDQAEVRQIRTPEYQRLRQLIDRLEQVVTQFEELDAEEVRQEQGQHRDP